MNRLKYTLCYLSGGMDRVPDGGVEWRARITPELFKMGIGVLNPCNKPSDFAEENANTRANIVAHKNAGEFQAARDIMKPICAVDLRLVDIAHFLVVYLDVESHLAGTYDEMSVARTQKKPILIVCPQGVKNIPNWWFGVIPYSHMFSSFDELMTYLSWINSDTDTVVEAHNARTGYRWRFFDFEKIYGGNLCIEQSENK